MTMRFYIAKFGPLLLLLGLFLLSVLIRAPWFNMDYVHQARYNEYSMYTNSEVYLHTGFVFDIYDKHPVSEHLFGSYIGQAPEFFSHKTIDAGVYTSFPPTLFIVPYIFFHFLGGHSYLALQIFSLALELLCIGLLYWLVLLLTKNRWIAVMGAGVYLFSTITLQQHMNVYWAHQLLQPVFFGALILFVKRKGLFRWWEALLVGLLLSIVTWTGAVGAIGFVLYGAWRLWQTKDKRYLNYLYIILGVVIALLAIFIQALVLAGIGPKEYLDAVSARVAARSTVSTFLPFPQLVIQFFRNLFVDLGIFFLIALAYARKLTEFEWAVVLIAAFPILESFVLLAHDTVYGFGRLKWLLPVILLICLAAARLKSRRLLYALVAVAGLIHVWLFTEVYKLI